MRPRVSNCQPTLPASPRLPPPFEKVVRTSEAVRLRLGLATAPEPADAADALAVALCHHLRRRAEARLEQAR